MSVETTITSEELAHTLPQVLERVRARGERFSIAQDGQPVALLTPTPRMIPFTVADFVSLWTQLPHPDEDFGAELEALQAQQRPAEPPAWPS